MKRKEKNKIKTISFTADIDEVSYDKLIEIINEKKITVSDAIETAIDLIYEEYKREEEKHNILLKKIRTRSKRKIADNRYIIITELLNGEIVYTPLSFSKSFKEWVSLGNFTDENEAETYLLWYGGSENELKSYIRKGNPCFNNIDDIIDFKNQK